MTAKDRVSDAKFEVESAAERDLVGLALGSAPAESGVAPPPDGNRPLFSGSVLLRQIQPFLTRIADSDVPVLFQGESGVGKEVLARYVHTQSPRARKPFLKLNCAALPSELLESELFGYERGAFTGAFKNKPGKFELADGGTLMLDEIGDMDFRLQAKLLHVLQDQEFQRLGAREVVRVDVRILAATHCDLECAIQEGRFREDLYYRLNVVNIVVPPLRDRPDEIIPLARHFLIKHSRPWTSLPEISAPLVSALLTYEWPGNIRELENLMRKLLVFRDPDLLAAELQQKAGKRTTAAAPPAAAPEVERPQPPAAAAKLPPDSVAVVEPAPNGDDGVPAAPQAGQPPVLTLDEVRETRRRLETEGILNALHAARWNRKKAARLLHIDYHALLYRMKKLGIDSRTEVSREAPASAPPVGTPTETDLFEKASRYQHQAEAQAILSALTTARWNRKRAAALLNMDYKALLYKMKKIKIA